MISEVRKKLSNFDTLKALEKLKVEGETFNIRLEEIDVLRQVRMLFLSKLLQFFKFQLIDYSEWRIDVTELIQKYTKAQNYALSIAQTKKEFKLETDSGLFDDDSRLCNDKLKTLISKGVRLNHYVDEVADLLETLQKIGLHVNLRHKQVRVF